MNWPGKSRRGLLILFAMLLVCIPAAAYPFEYHVSPADTTGARISSDLARVPFSDLSPREMAIAEAFILSPAFILPVELLFALKIFSCLAFRRILKKNILSSAQRSNIYHLIASVPGIGVAALCRQAGASRGSLNYHLALLKHHNKISEVRVRVGIGYCVSNGDYGDVEQRVMKYLQNDAGKRVLGAIAETPGITRTGLMGALGLEGPSVTWHTQRLASEGIIIAEKEGRFARYTLSERARICYQSRGA
jgi:predicted transcriptional regulator